ncbi:glycosyltransferase family 4 protein [Hymenobacter artigasi]|nr:glycosyltransferase family 4 protein [Hymenobacter artigasi]
MNKVLLCMLPDKQLRVLIVDNSRAITGALNAMRRATQSLRSGIHFEWVLPVGSTCVAELEADGYVVHELPFVELSRRKSDLLLYLPMLLLNGWRLHRLAARRQVDILHLNDFYNLTAYAARWLSGCKLLVVAHVRFLPQAQVSFLARGWRWLAENAAQQVLCVSEAVRSYFASDSVWIHTVYDPLPVRGEKLLPHIVSHDNTSPVRLLYLSNYIRGKGQNLALEAFQSAYARNPNLRLRFMGGNMGMGKNQEFQRELETAAQALNLVGIVHFEGFVVDTEAAIKAHDIILNFSEAESFSLTCLDALYYGVPLIASDCGGPTELFEAGKSGLLVPNRNVSAMADAIVALAADEGLRHQFSGAGRIFVRQKFAPAHTYELLAGYYQQALANA